MPRAHGLARNALLVIGAGVLFGTSGTASSFAPANVNPLSIGAARLAFGGLLLALFGLVMWFLHRRGKPRNIAHPGGKWVTVLTIVLAASGVMGFQATFFVGTSANGVAVGTVLAIGSSPLLAGIIEWIVLKIRPGWLWLGATALAVTGIALISLVNSGQAQGTDLMGMLASLAAGGFYAGYAVATKLMLNNGWHGQDAVSICLGVGSVMGFIMLANTDHSWLAQPAGIGVTAWLAVFTIVFSYSLVGKGLSGLSAATAATLNLAEPATAAMLGVLLLSERLTWNSMLGIVLVVGAVLVLSLFNSGSAQKSIIDTGLRN